MKKSIVSYYNAKFEDVPEITFVESFNFQPDKREIIRTLKQRSTVAASIVILIFSVYFIEKDIGFFQSSDISNTAQNEEPSNQSASESFEGSEEVANIIDLFSLATESSTFQEADLSEAIRALDNYENTVNIEDMVDADKFIIWLYRGNISIRDRNFRQAVQFYENILGLDTISQENKDRFQRTTDQLNDILERQANQ